MPAHLDATSAERIIDRLRSRGAVFAYLHGSRASGDARPGSDIDVAAWWSTAAPNVWEFDLGTEVDLLCLNDAPLELAGRVAMYGRLLFEDDAAARVRWEATTRKIWLDERPRVDRARREALAAMMARG